jgi:hypothetical protein
VCDDAAVVPPWSSASGMAREQQAMLLHQPVNSLCIDRRAAAGTPLALYERGDPTVAIGWSGIDMAPDFGGQLGIAFTDPRPALWANSFDALCDVGARHAQSLGDCLHRKAPRAAELDSEIVLFCASEIEGVCAIHQAARFRFTPDILTSPKTWCEN